MTSVGISFKRFRVHLDADDKLIQRLILGRKRVARLLVATLEEDSAKEEAPTEEKMKTKPN